MARPKPHIYMWRTDGAKIEEVISSADAAVYVLLLDGVPVGLRRRTLNADPQQSDLPKYPRTQFSNPGHAIRLAERCNRVFKCDRFSTGKLVGQGVIVVERRQP